MSIQESFRLLYYDSEGAVNTTTWTEDQFTNVGVIAATTVFTDTSNPAFNTETRGFSVTRSGAVFAFRDLVRSWVLRFIGRTCKMQAFPFVFHCSWLSQFYNGKRANSQSLDVLFPLCRPIAISVVWLHLIGVSSRFVCHKRCTIFALIG